jgi:hypothetical protein
LQASHVGTLTQNSYQKKDPHFKLVDLRFYSGLQDEIYL